MPGIFISYRRQDTAYQAGHIYDRLAQHFGEQVYKDVESIPLGDDFVRVIEELLERSAVVLVLIGDNWLAPDPHTGRARLEDPDDFVRREIELALASQKVIIPIVLGQAEIPEADRLPESLRPLAHRNGMRVSPAPHFHRDLERLIRTIEPHVRAPRGGAGVPEAAAAAARGNRFLRVLAGLLAQDYPQEQRRVDVRRLANRLADGWRFGTRESDRREDLQALIHAGEGGLRAEVEAAAAAAEPSNPALGERLGAYLAQVVVRVRHDLGRGGRAAQGRLDGEEDLLPLLPAYWPRFRPGDRPLPQVDWELAELLGAGGYGEVWKANNPEFAGIAPVALKFCLDENVRQKLLGYEAQLISQILAHGSHPGIVPLRQAYLKANPPCLEYEFVDGGDLVHFPVPAAGPERVARVRDWVRQLAETVGHFHLLTPPVVHRDLKPANVLVARGPDAEVRLRVADFGIGRLVADMEHSAASGGEAWPNVRPPTAVRTSFTPLYASPQQQRGEPPDPRDDVYSLGVIWYQLLTDNRTAGPPRGRQWWRDLSVMGMPDDDLDLLGACMEEDQTLRPANAAELARRLGGAPAATSDTGVLRLHELATPRAPAAAATDGGSSGPRLTLRPDTARIRLGVDELTGGPSGSPSGAYPASPGTVPSPAPYQPTVPGPAPPLYPRAAGLAPVRQGPPGADTEAGTLRALWLWFAICRGAGSLVWACVLLFAVVAVLSESTASTTDQGALIGMGVLEMIGGALYLVDTVLLLILLHRCWALLEDAPGAVSPGLAVGLLFVPFFNLYWVFVAFYRLARVMNGQLRRCQIWKPQVPEALGLAVCVVWCASIVAGVLTGAASVFFLLALVLCLANSVLWILFAYWLAQAAAAVAAARNDSVAQPV